MAICGMTNEERQILINQYAIMTFLLGVHIKDMNGINECAFKGLQQSIESTGIVLEEDNKIKSQFYKQFIDKKDGERDGET